MRLPLFLALAVLLSTPVTAHAGEHDRHGWHHGHHDDDDHDEWKERHHKRHNRPPQVVIVRPAPIYQPHIIVREPVYERHVYQPQQPAFSLRFSDDDFSIAMNWSNRDTTYVSDWDDISPSLARHICAHNRLQPGLVMKRVPYTLANRLGPAPWGYDHIVIGHDIVLVDLASGEIADIMEDVL